MKFSPFTICLLIPLQTATLAMEQQFPDKQAREQQKLTMLVRQPSLSPKQQRALRKKIDPLIAAVHASQSVVEEKNSRIQLNETLFKLLNNTPRTPRRAKDLIYYSHLLDKMNKTEQEHPTPTLKDVLDETITCLKEDFNRYQLSHGAEQSNKAKEVLFTFAKASNLAKKRLIQKLREDRVSLRKNLTVQKLLSLSLHSNFVNYAEKFHFHTIFSIPQKSFAGFQSADSIIIDALPRMLPMIALLEKINS